MWCFQSWTVPGGRNPSLESFDAEVSNWDSGRPSAPWRSLPLIKTAPILPVRPQTQTPNPVLAPHLTSLLWEHICSFIMRWSEAKKFISQPTPWKYTRTIPFFKILFLCWHIVDWQGRVHFRYTAKWFSYTYIYIFFFFFRFFSLIGHYKILSRVPCAIW